VLDNFEADLANQAVTPSSPMAERARGVAEDVGDLLAPEELVSLDAPDPVVPAAEKSRASSGGTVELTLVPDEPTHTKQASG